MNSTIALTRFGRAAGGALFLLVVGMTAPKDAQACSACMFGLFQEIFPFLRNWAQLFLVWTVAFLLWYLVGRFSRTELPGKPGRTILEMLGLFLIIVTTGYSVLLAYWAVVVILQLRTAWKGTDTLASAQRRFGIGLGAVTIVLLTVSLPVSMAGHLDPKNMVARINKPYRRHDFGQAYLRQRIVSRGRETAPLLRKMLDQGIRDPVCGAPEQYPEPIQCARADSAAGLLGELHDTASVNLLTSALSLGQGKSLLAETAEYSLRRIGSLEARKVLKKTGARERFQ